MNEPLEFTGERFTPECEREIWYEHLHRYAMARGLCRGRVLDAACGEGYGSALLAATATEVVGLDLSQAAIEHARLRYRHLPNLRFASGDCTALPFADGEFDCIVSFETLEHLADQDGMLREFRRVLKPDGFLLLSSPDKAQYSDLAGYQNPFHVRELYRTELEELLQRHFSHIRLYGQKLAFHSVIWSLTHTGAPVLSRAEGQGVRDCPEVPLVPLYFIAACANSEAALPDTDQGLWLFDDATESVYSHYIGEIRRNMAAGGIIAERDRRITELQLQLDSVRAESGQRLPWYQRWFGSLFGQNSRRG